MSTQNNYSLLQRLYKMVLDENTQGIEFHGPFTHPPKHDLWLCTYLASQLTEDQLVVVAAGDNDDPHMAPLNNLLTDFFNISMDPDSPASIATYLSTKQGSPVTHLWVPC